MKSASGQGARPLKMHPNLELLTLLDSNASEAAFQAALTQLDWDLRMQARRTASAGKPYNYSGMTYLESPWPDWLLPIRDQVELAVGHLLNNCLANHYEGGSATMGFHSDSQDGLAAGSRVAIVSLGAARTLRFRLQRDRAVGVDVRLEPGSLLHMGADVQSEWHHAVPAEPGAGPRISLTFRQMG